MQYQPLVLPLESGDSSAVDRVRAGRPDHDQQHMLCCTKTSSNKLEKLLHLVG